MLRGFSVRFLTLNGHSSLRPQPTGHAPFETLEAYLFCQTNSKLHLGVPPPTLRSPVPLMEP